MGTDRKTKAKRQLAPRLCTGHACFRGVCERMRKQVRNLRWRRAFFTHRSVGVLYIKPSTSVFSWVIVIFSQHALDYTCCASHVPGKLLCILQNPASDRMGEMLPVIPPRHLLCHGTYRSYQPRLFTPLSRLEVHAHGIEIRIMQLTDKSLL